MDTEHDAPGPTFGLLGPVAAWQDGVPVPLGGAKSRVLLAVLVTHRRRVVSVRQLVDAVWGPTPPRSATKMVQVLVSQLRRTLGPDGATSIRTAEGGYALDCDEDAVDVARARALYDEGRRQLAARPDDAARCFRAALNLWRGEPLCDVAGELSAAALASELVELQHEVFASRIAADFALGRHAELVGELRSYAEANPARERAHADLMLALYGSGRQTDALDVARHARTRLANDFGLDTGHTIADLERRILQHDPTLKPRDPPASTHRQPYPRGDATTTREKGSAGNGPAPRRPSRRPAVWVSAVIAAAAAAVAAGIGLSVHTEPPAPAASTHTLAADSVAVFDAVSGDVRADVPVGGFPGPVVVANGSTWVCDRAAKTVTKIDSSSFVTRNVIGLAQAPQQATATSGQVWVSLGLSGKVARIDAANNQITSAFYPARAVEGFVDLAGARSTVWVGTSDSNVSEMSAADAVVVARTQLPRRSEQIAATPTEAWTATASGVVYRITHGHRPAAIIDLHESAAAMIAAYGSVWVTTDKLLLRLSPDTGRVLARYSVNRPPAVLAAGAGAIWVAENPSGDLERIPVARDAPRTTFSLGYPIGGMALSGTSLWVTLDHR